MTVGAPAGEAGETKDGTPKEQSAPADSRMIRVRAVDKQSGKPLSGVAVKALIGGDDKLAATTDDHGEARLELPPGDFGFVSVSVSKAGHAKMYASWGTGGSPLTLPAELCFRMPPTVTVGGVVHNEDGQPVKDARMILSEWYGTLSQNGTPCISVRAEMTTDERGRWECDQLPADFQVEGLRVELWSAGYNENGFSEKVASSRADLLNRSAILLLKWDRHVRATVTGTVTDQQDRPIEGATIWMGSEHRVRIGPRGPEDASEPVTTDARGGFRIENARSTRPGSWTDGQIFDDLVLTVQAKGYSPDLKVIKLSTTTPPVEFQLAPGQTMRGRVVDVVGKPVEGVKLEASKWRGHGSLRWQGTSDIDGRFVFEDAPADPVMLNLRKDGYMSIREQVATATEGEVVITMKPALRFRGKVTDAVTEQPVERFQVIRGGMWQATDGVTWNQSPSPQSGGTYEVLFDQAQAGHAIRIEAPGYTPVQSPVVAAEPSERTFDFELQRAEGPSGTVRLPDGTPAVGAQVYLCLPDARDFGVSFTNGVIGDEFTPAFEMRFQRAVCDDAGRFKFDPQSEPYAIAILHDRGYAEVVEKDLRENTTVTLKPFGRVEGVLRRGAAPRPDTSLRMTVNVRGYEPPRVTHFYPAETDEYGRFVIEKVVPGKGEIGPMRTKLRFRGVDYCHPFQVEPGQTTRVVLGGRGRPVVGRVVPPEGIVVDLERYVSLPPSLRKANPQLPDDVRDGGAEAYRTWWAEWSQTDTGKKWNALPSYFRGELNKDGTFRFDEVPPGRWAMYADLNGRASSENYVRAVARLTHEFDVPEMTEEHNDEPLDLGTLTAEPVVQPLEMGQVAPDFEATTLEGQTLKLADFRGKYVLLDFWATWCGPCLKEVPHLKTIYSEFGRHDRFVMIGVSLDRKKDDLLKYLREQDLRWAQVFPDGGWKARLTEAYHIVGIPAIFLIGPDGKIVATNLRAPGTRAAVEKALAQP